MSKNAAIAVTTTLLIACGAPAEDEMSESAPGMSSPSQIGALLADGEVVFGVFPGQQTAEGGTAMAARFGMDFVFYDLENGPFDLEAYHTYVDAMTAALGPDTPRRAMALRIPPVGADPDGAIQRALEALEAGIDILVVPHVQNATQATVVVEATGRNAWPTRPDGAHVNLLIIEDQEGIANASEIVATPGVSIVFAGPGDLRRAYEGDMEAVENAIQVVLAACKEHEVPCGVTAGPDNIADRIEQGFRAFIVQQQEAVEAGRTAAGR
ncbi:MAG: aldolase/citrate lyase family protein [Gemmatimonadota bacterium]|nr:aldolase/citrate lyase family protein [Gemmatimonadota bacterium]